MEKLTNTTRPGVLSFVGHTPGFWPQESLVCIALNEKVSARPFASTTPADPARNSRTHARDLRPDGRHQCCIHHLRRLHQRNHPPRTDQPPRRQHRRAHRSPRRAGHHHPGRPLRRKRDLLPLRRRPRHQPHPCPSAPSKQARSTPISCTAAASSNPPPGSPFQPRPGSSTSGRRRTRLPARKHCWPSTPASSPTSWRGGSSTRYSCASTRNSLYWYLYYSSCRMPLGTGK